MKKVSLKKFTSIGMGAMLIVGLFGGLAFAAGNSNLNQTINPGAIATDILDAGRVSVASPSVSMSAKNFSFDCQAGVNASTGSLGSAAERVYVTNADAADNGWTLTVAATAGSTAAWSDGSSSFDFNDPTGTTSGCDDGADGDSVAGQLTIDPSVGTLTTDCGSCVVTNVSKGSSAEFSQGAVDSITLLNAAAGSDDIWRGYLTGATLSQTIPAETPASTFSLNLTLTATAL